MPDVLLARAIKQAGRCQAPVRAAALLRIARVETATNPSAARNTFERGLDPDCRSFTRFGVSTARS
jgi:hypothetical protein